MRFSVKKGLLAGVFALAIPFVLGGSVQGQEPLVVSGLQAPRGLTATDSRVLIAEQAAGRIIRVAPNGNISVIAEGLPATVSETPEGALTAGVTAVIEVNGTFYFTVGEAPGEAGFDSVYSVTRGGEPELIAELLPYEQENNVDGGTNETSQLVNLYDLAWDGADGLYVSASGANAIFHVSFEGEITSYAVFKARQNPMFPGRGRAEMEQVPTGLVVGPDGALYVSTLTGFPFPAGEARVYRMEDKDGDGDALEPGETTIYAEGLTSATDLAFDQDGSLLVTEFSTSMLAGAPGRLVRVVDGEIGVVAEPLDSPTGLAVLANGTALVTMEFLGIVAEPEAAAALVAAGGDEEAPEEGGQITPPSTGDAGLLGRSSGGWMMLAGVAMLLSSLAAATVVVRRSA